MDNMDIGISNLFFTTQASKADKKTRMTVFVEIENHYLLFPDYY